MCSLTCVHNFLSMLYILRMTFNNTYAQAELSRRNGMMGSR